MRCPRKCILAKIISFVGLLLLIVFMEHCIMNEFVTSATKNSKSYLKYSNCEVIHIGVACTGYGNNLHVYSMLKSLYYFRNNPLHFHLIVDDVSGQVLRKLFETWTVPQVNTSFYDIKPFTSEIWWMQKYQYYPERLCKLLKFIFPKVIATDVTNMVIVIDADTIFASDVHNLWNLFDNFTKKQAIGLVKHRNNDYLTTVTQWSTPADEYVQRSYSSADVILYDLKSLKENGHTEKFLKIVDHAVSSFGETKVTDQAVINAILDRSNNLVYHIPSSWIYQLQTDYGYYNTTNIKILDSSKSSPISTDNDDNYDKLYHRVLDYNGTLLLNRIYGCGKNLNTGVPLAPKDDNCSDFHDAENHQWRTLLFFREFEYNVTEDDVTFVSQLSYSRRHVLEELATLWKGPISLTVYVTDSELHAFIDFIENSRPLRNRSDIAYHAVFKDGDDHPINVLRNLALRHVITPYVFLVDIDFLPMPDLYLILKSYISDVNNMENTALIVPAFETKKYLPNTKKELLEMWHKGTVLPFHQKLYRQAHAPTNFQKWTTAQDIYQVSWKPNFEPYIVVQKNVTNYDERFFGYGWNKVSHIMELKEQGYQFLVLPNVFVVHKPHKWSSDRRKFVRSRRQQKCVQKLKYKFIKEIKKKYSKNRSKISTF